MNKKLLPYLFLACLAVAAIIIRQVVAHGQPATKTEKQHADRRRSTGGRSDDVATNPKRGFDRTHVLIYTRHARCRMGCRHITENEVQLIQQKGEINYRKSNLDDLPCPTYAIEGYSTAKEHLRIVFAQCDNTTKVVTCIDLDKDFTCDCN